MNTEYLSPNDLADHWNISPRTLERWRWLQQGPAYVKVGGSVRYSRADIEAFERRCRRQASQDAILGAWKG